jgi:hypothetical protein
LRETIPITPRPGEEKRVVMSLGPRGSRFSRMPDLEPGDRLHMMTEVEVTIDHSTQRRGSVGKPYRYSPFVRASLLLARDRDAVKADGERAVLIHESKLERLTHRQHHRVIVCDRSITVPNGDPRRHVNLVLQAHHPRAVPGNVLLVGESEPDGSVGQDKGRLNVVRIRPGSHPRPTPRRTRSRKAEAISVIPTRRTVVYSKRLDGLREREQLEVRARMRVSAAHLPYPARVSTRVFLADRPSAIATGGRAARISPFGGEVGEHNGYNCDGRCTTRRVGVLRIEKSPGRRLYVNVVAESGDPSKRGNAKPGDRLRVLKGGELEVVRYDPSLKG